MILLYSVFHALELAKVDPARPVSTLFHLPVCSSQCPNEVEALQRCRLVRPGDDCEFEDMDAMRCASIRVLQAASAPPAASRRA